VNASDEMLVALWDLEQKLIGTWLSGAKFRERWTPDPADFELREHVALATACMAMARAGTGTGNLEMALLGELRSLRLLSLWPVDRNLLNGTLSRDPDADLSRWKELRCLIALRRSLQATLSSMCAGSDLSEVREAILGATSKAYVSGALPALTLAEWHQAGYASMTEQDHSGSFVGISDLDHFTGGIRAGSVWVLGAPTNWGKSSFLIAIVDHYTQVHGGGVLLVSCEDDPVMLGARKVCRSAGISGKNARHSRLTQKEHDAAVALLTHTPQSAAPIIADGRGRPVEVLCEQIRNMHAINPIGLVLVDYLQCIGTQRQIEDRRHQLNYIARSLTDTIKGIGAAGVIASQLTDERIRDSQDVEHAAEVVLIGRREEAVYGPDGEPVEQAKLSLHIKKNKSGPRGAVVQLEWDNHTGSFVTRDTTFAGYFEEGQ
jgi:hypothetical protein